MKRFCLLIIFLVVNLDLFSQITTTPVKQAELKNDIHEFDGSKNFCGKDAEQYIGEILYLKGKPESLQKYGYENFYSNLEQYEKNKYKRWDYEKLAERYFLVEDVMEAPDKDRNYRVLKLKANDNGEVLYFRYDIRYEHSFPFIAVKYFEQVRASHIGKSFAVTGHNWISSEPMTDMVTGEIVKEFESGKIWRCVDVTVETRFYTLALILENNFGQRIPLGIDRIGVYASEVETHSVKLSTGTNAFSTKNGLEYTEQTLPTADGITLRENGERIVEQNKIASLTDSYGLNKIAHTFGIKTQSFLYEGTQYVLLNDGDYKYFLIKNENWKTDLYENVANVNVIPVFRSLIYEEIQTRNLDYLIPALLKEVDSYSKIVLFTKYDTETHKVYYLSPIFFDNYSFEKSLPNDSEYPMQLPDNYYFSISDTEFISFFNASIKQNMADAVFIYNYDNLHLVAHYDRYDGNTWIYPSEKYEIFSSDNVSLQLYIGKFSSGTKTLRMSVKTMGCNKYYDCIKSITFLNSDNERLSIDIPFKNTDYSHSHASCDILMKFNEDESFDLQKLKDILLGNKAEVMLSFAESYRHSYFINKAKANELVFMIDSFENMIKDK